MKKLLKISIKIWAALAVVITSSIILLVVLLRMNVESTYKTDVVVSKTSTSDLIIDSKSAYILKDKDQVILRVNARDYAAKIDSVSYDEKAKHFIAHIKGLGKILIPSTTVPAQIIYDHTSVWGALVNPGV